MNKKSLYKSQLAKMYGIHKKTLLRWIKNMPNLTITKYQRKLTPREVEKIINFLGEP